MFGIVYAMVAEHHHIMDAIKELNVQADAHGVRSGWFNWPANFDPVWLVNCDGYTPKENKDDNTPMAT
jgi:hypothetical protein